MALSAKLGCAAVPHPRCVVALNQTDGPVTARTRRTSGLLAVRRRDCGRSDHRTYADQAAKCEGCHGTSGAGALIAGLRSAPAADPGVRGIIGRIGPSIYRVILSEAKDPQVARLRARSGR